MKAERRHELKENVLAKDLGRAEEFVARQWKSLILGALVVVVLILVGVRLIQGRSNTRQAERQSYQSLLQNYDAWYAQALEAYNGLKQEDEDKAKAARVAYSETLIKLTGVRQELRSLAGKTSQKGLAALCYAQAGQMAYAELLLQEKELAESDRKARLDEAQGDFRQVLSQYGDHKPAAGLAHFGLGLLAETQRDFDTARKEYKQVVDLGREALRSEEAAAKLKLLDSSELAKVVKFAASAPAPELPIDIETQPATEPADAETQPAAMPAEGASTRPAVLP